MNWCKMVICFSKYLPGMVLWKFIWFRVEEGTKSWMESEMPDNCHQKSFPITCQAFWVLRLLLLRQNQNLDTVSRVPKDDSNEMIWVGIPIVFVFVPGWGPMESQSKKIPRAPAYLSHFNICEAKGVPQNGMSNQIHSTKVCLNLSALEPDLPWPFPGEGEKKHVWRFEWAAKKRVHSEGSGTEVESE